jgi:hypothetical protein
MSKDHSEPAFPSASHEYGPVLGLSIRDYFAAKAMQGWSANPIPQDSSIQEVAAWAYRQADAMIEARAK